MQVQEHDRELQTAARRRQPTIPGGPVQRHIDRKVLGLALTAGLVFGTGGVVVASFTSSGTGTGHTEVGTTTGTFDITTDGPGCRRSRVTGHGPFDVAISDSGATDAHIGTVRAGVARYGASCEGWGRSVGDAPGPDRSTIDPAVERLLPDRGGCE
jgi:hypothetical protein